MPSPLDPSSHRPRRPHPRRPFSRPAPAHRRRGGRLLRRLRRGAVAVVALATIAPLGLVWSPETAQAAPCRTDRRGVPSCGAYLGAAHGANDVPGHLERRAGRPLGVRRTYFTGSQVSGAVRIAAQDLRAGRLPWLSFKLPHSWQQMAAGRGDAWARDLSARLADLDGPVWVAFHHEPEGDGDIRAWRAMQERLAPLVRRAAPNVAFTVILTGWHQLYGDPAYALRHVWPRGVKVDVAGFDVYNLFGVESHGKVIDEWPRMHARYFRHFKRFARHHDTRWALGETALTDAAARRAPRWVERVHERLVRDEGVAMAYFDTEINALGSFPLTRRSRQTDFVNALRGSLRLP
ncbi:hypothetical protein BKA05_003724 [Nocardioides marinus]|uniref:GH26 domain-containing protein n=2 Tax=Nocardioides marinus TaxID=374514 RepID=A0A7Y9YI76_9ACTN|nr:hypothetical protein [Nocardioides marinus]NYI12209.1 hypothetical protein [Nocardioides marinus]